MFETLQHGGRRRAAAVALVVVAGVASNLATTPVALSCDEREPYGVTVAGGGQTGAATAPLGRRLAVAVTCRATPGGSTIVAQGVAATWAVETGGGRVDGAAERTKSTGDDGTAAVTWTLGPAIGEQTVSLTVRDQRHTLRATAGGAASGGTCSGGAGTELEDLRAVESDEHWPLAGSPYRGALLRVAAGGRLTVAPGVTVCLRDLVVEPDGELRADGTPDQPIRMAPSLPSGGTWSARLDGRLFDPAPLTLQNLLRHVHALNLTSLQVAGAPLLLEDSRFTIDLVDGAGATVLWSVAPVAAGGESAARRVVFEGYGVPPAFGRTPALSVVAPAMAASAPVPFEIRMLRARGHAVQVSGNGEAIVALQACEISDTAGIGLIVRGARPPVSVSGCNLSGNAEHAVYSDVAGGPPVDARGNWWGDPAGAPTAGGNAVTAGVDASAPAPVPFTLGY